MTVPAVAGGALPSLPVAGVPRAVREGTREVQDAYRSALAFEQVLVQQLAQGLTETATPAGEDAGSATSQAYRQQLPQALADGVGAAGGLGLAAQLYPGFLPPTTPPDPQRSTP